MPEKAVPKGGRFLGSISALFKKRAAADIHFENYWISAGDMYRVCFSVGAWGYTFVLVEKARREQAGGEHTPYKFCPLSSLMSVLVEDEGQQFVDREDVPPSLPPDDDFQAEYEVDGELYPVLAIPWHHSVVVRKHPDWARTPFHYHQAKRRGSGRDSPPPPRPQDKGSHFTFNHLRVSAQVQSSRRGMPAP